MVTCMVKQHNGNVVERRLLTIDNFCAMYSISRPTLYRLWGRGDGPAWVRLGGRRLIARDDADNWVRAHREQHAA